MVKREKMKKQIKNQQFKEEILQSEKEADEQLSKSLNQNQSKTLEMLYFFPREFVKMVINKNSRGLILWGESSCLPKNTKIRTPFGNKNIQKVNSVLSYNTLKAKLEIKPVKVIKKGKKRLMKIYTKLGIIKCSYNHLWYVRRRGEMRIIKAKELKKTDRLLKYD